MPPKKLEIAMQNSEALLDAMKAAQEMANGLSSSVSAILDSPDLTVEGATGALDAVVRYLAMIDGFFEAIETAAENETIDLELEESASDFAETAHDLGLSLQQAALDRLRSLGVNANRALASAQAEHYPPDEV